MSKESLQQLINESLESIGSGVPEEKQEPRPRVALGSLISGALDSISSEDASVDRSGVPDFGFRASFSRMDNEKERVKFLNKQVGPGGFAKDKFGEFVITPKGMDRLGLPHQGKPVSIDEKGLSRFDIADLRGSAPAIGGSILGPTAVGTTFGPAGSVAGFTAGLMSAAVGAMGAKGVDEALDAFRGDNEQSISEIAGDIAQEGKMAMGGEAGAQLIMAGGRKLLAPEAKRVSAEMAQLVRESRDIGAQPTVAQVTKAPLLSRMQAMTSRIFGDPFAAKNAEAIMKASGRLARSLGNKLDGKEDLGLLIETNIRAARRRFGQSMSGQYQLVDDYLAGNPVIPTRNLKQAANDLVEDLPPSKTTGDPVLTDPETMKHIRGILELPEYISARQMQRLRTRLFDAKHGNDIIQGVSARDAKALHDAATSTFKDAQDNLPSILAKYKAESNVELDETIAEEALSMFDQARKNYGKGIKKFDNNLIARITRDPSMAGKLEPEAIVGSVFRKGSVTPIKKLMRVLPDETKKNIRREAMDDILQKMYRPDQADPINQIFDGVRFRKILNDDYGRETLNAMFGAEKTEELYRLANIVHLVTSKPQFASGGLVAASIAVRPLANMGRLLKLRTMASVMSSDVGMKWLTTGLEAKTARKAGAAMTRFGTQLATLRDKESDRMAGESVPRVARFPEAQ